MQEVVPIDPWTWGNFSRTKRNGLKITTFFLASLWVAGLAHSKANPVVEIQVRLEIPPWIRSYKFLQHANPFYLPRVGELRAHIEIVWNHGHVLQLSVNICVISIDLQLQLHRWNRRADIFFEIYDTEDPVRFFL
jgi:hypothetical protein